MPHAGPYPAHHPWHRVEALVAGDHLPDDSIKRQALVAGHWKGQGVVTPVIRKRVESDAVFALHLVPQAGAGRGREEQGIEAVDAILSCRFSNALSDAGLVDV